MAARAISKHSPQTGVPPVVSPGLRRLLVFVLALFGLLAVNSLYLVVIDVAGQLGSRNHENYFYLLMFLAHLGLGLLLLVPALLFGALHMRRAWGRDNRYAVRAGLALYSSVIVLLVSGILLTRFGFFEIDDPRVREPAYWLHLMSPLVLIWLFVLHRLAGPPLRWRSGAWWTVAAGVFAAVALGLHLWMQPPAPQLTHTGAERCRAADSGRTSGHR